MDNPSYGVLVDRSGWPVEKIITQKTKQEFIVQLLAEELITKHTVALNRLREGLDHFGLLDMMGSTDVGGDLFVTANSKTTLTAEKLLLCFEKSTTSARAQLLAYNNLKKFIAVNDSVKG